MDKQFTFFILGSTGSCSRQVTFSKSVLTFWGLISVICLTAMSYLLYDYYSLREKTGYCVKLEQQITSQREELACQRKQIQVFADQLNAIKTRLVTLDGLEKKVRTIANIDKATIEKKDNYAGIGGSMPEDLDAKIPLTQKHNSLLREMHEQVDQLDLAVSKEQSDLETLLKELEEQQNLLACKPTIRPVEGRITSKFGYRKSPFANRRELHKGIDIANRKGTPVVATANGIVTFVGRKGSFGKMVIINHGHGIVTRYAHLDKIKIKRGGTVKRGNIIGTIGNTGRSTGPHLHYEVRLNGLPVNPSKYFLN